MKYVAVATQLLALHADAYTLVATPPAHGRNALSVRMDIATDVKRTAKSVTGSSFLPPEAIERAKEGNPIEKAKLAKQAWEEKQKERESSEDAKGAFHRLHRAITTMRSSPKKNELQTCLRELQKYI